MNEHLFRIATFALISSAAALVVGLGLARQPSDPPRDLSVSIGVLDEGIWSHNAANDALFGRARLDDFNPWVVTSGSLLYRASYAVAGVGITQTRLPSIALGGLAVLLTGTLLWRERPVAGIVGAWLLAGCYLYLAYSRLGLLETPALAFLLGGLLCLMLGLAGKRAALCAVGGALAAAAVTIKIQSAAPVLGVAAGIAIWYTLSGRRTPENKVPLLSAVAGALGAGAIWVVHVVTHLDAAARAEWNWHSAGVAPRLGDIPSNLSDFIQASDGVGTRARALLVAAAAGFLLQAVAWAANRWRPGALQFAAAGWATAGIFAVAMLPYTPSRYVVLALPGLALTAGSGVIAAGALASGGSRRVIFAVALTGVAAATVLGIRSWNDWTPTYDLRRTAQVLARTTQPGDVIIGGWGLLPSLEAHRHVVAIRVPGINDVCPIERFGASWILMEHTEADRNFYDRLYPGLLTDVTPTATASVLGHPLDLYRIPSTPRPSCASRSTRTGLVPPSRLPETPP